MRMPPRFWALLLLAIGSAGFAAPPREIIVSAGASLTEVFTEAARQYEARHPDVRVLLNFGASGSLLQQIAMGAPVDVFASADQETMDRAARKGLIRPGQRHDFAGNALVVAVPRDSRLAIGTLADLHQPAVRRIAIGNPATVPAGRYAHRALRDAGHQEALSGKLIATQNVRQALDYVARGEVEAAFVYRTDVLVMPERVRQAFVVPLAKPIRYPIAAVADSRHPDDAARFIAFVRGEEGQALLRRHGFLSP